MSVVASDAVAVGEFSLSIIALAYLWMVFLVDLRRWNDLLRRPFLWLKWAIPLFFLYGQTTHAIGLYQYMADIPIPIAQLYRP